MSLRAKAQPSVSFRRPLVAKVIKIIGLSHVLSADRAIFVCLWRIYAIPRGSSRNVHNVETGGNASKDDGFPPVINAFSHVGHANALNLCCSSARHLIKSL